jgi:hypothetical protein
MDSALQSAALILTSIAVLLSAWSKDFDHILDSLLEVDYQQIETECELSKRIYKTRALPLFIISVVASTLYFPKVIEALLFTPLITMNMGLNEFFKSYDVTSVVFILVVIVLILLSIHLCVVTIGIRRKNRELEEAMRNFGGGNHF